MSGTHSHTALLHAVLAAGEAPDLDLQGAIITAYSWHGGGGSAFYAFASNGGVIADENQRQQLIAEADQTIAWVQTNAGDINSGKFPEYADDAEEAQEKGLTTSDLILARLDNLKSIAQQAVIVKEASKQAGAPLDADELKLYMENSSELYPQKASIIRNLKRKMDKGTYDPNLAWRLWLYWVVAGAQAYAKEIGGGLWYQLFPVPVRQTLAKELAAKEEQALRNGEYEPTTPTKGPEAPLPEPVMAAFEDPTAKEAKIVVSEDVFRRAQAECEQMLQQVYGSGSELEGKLTKIQHELNKIEVGSGGDLAFMLDDEENPETATWARQLIRALGSLRAGVGQGAPVGQHVNAAGFAETTLKAIIQFARTHRDDLRQLLGTHGPQAVAAEIGKIPGAGNFAPRVAPAFVQWLSGNTDDNGFVGMLERFFSKRGSLEGEDAMHMVSGALRMAGLHPSMVKATGRDITLEGLRVNAHVLRITAKVAGDYGLNLRLQKASAAYNQPGEQPGTFPEPPRQEPNGLQHAAPEGEPVVTPAEAAKEASTPKEAIGPWGGQGYFVRQTMNAPKAPVPPQPSSAGNHAGPRNPANPTGDAPAAPAAQAPQQNAQAPAVPAPAEEQPTTPTGYGQHPGGAAYGQKQAVELSTPAAAALSALGPLVILVSIGHASGWLASTWDDVKGWFAKHRDAYQTFHAVLRDPQKVQNMVNLLETMKDTTRLSASPWGNKLQHYPELAKLKQLGVIRVWNLTPELTPLGEQYLAKLKAIQAGNTRQASKQASEVQGDLYAAVESAYDWHSGQSSYLYSFASLGGVLYKESWRGGLENEVESAIEAVNKAPQNYEADELEKLENLLQVVKTIPAQTNDEEQDEMGVRASKQAADGNLTGTLTEIESMLNSLQELADTAVAQARLQGDPDLSANVERINVKVYEALMATRTGKVDAKDKPGPETDGAQTVTLVPVAASTPKEAIGPWGGQGHFVRQTLHAPAPGVCKTPECGEKAEANGYCTYCGDPRSIPGKCDFCGAPVPPELKEENVCPGCAGGLRGTSYGGDEAAHRMMSSLHVAAPVAPPPVFTAEEADQWLEAIKTQIPAPYVGGYVSTLGGAQNASILMTISVDPKESWPNHILENSTYAKLHLTNDGVLKVISGYVKRPGGAPGRIQFRKSRVKDLPGAIAKLTALTTYLSSEREAAPAAPVLASKQAANQLTKGPDASKGDTVDNAIEWVNANSGDLEDCTVQELRDGLAAAGYTQQVADEAVTELLGNEALMALATPVKHLLG